LNDELNEIWKDAGHIQKLTSIRIASNPTKIRTDHLPNTPTAVTQRREERRTTGKHEETRREEQE
jgi:hypothetical protein